MSHDTFPGPSRPLATPPIVSLVYIALQWLLGLLFRIEVKGQERIPANGPYILIANHLSYFDPLLLLAVFPLQPRIWFLAAAQHTTSVGWRRTFLRMTGGILAIHDGDPGSGRRALRDAEHVLNAGGVVGIFPEGRVGRVEGRLQPVYPGASSLALRMGVPILPVWIAGTRRVYWRKHIQLVVGEPFHPPWGVTRAAATSSLAQSLLDCRQEVEPVAEPANPRGLWLNRLL